MIRAVLAVALAAGVAGPALSDAAADEAAIRARFTAWTAAFNAGDAAGACDLFAADLAYAFPGVPQGTQATMCGNLARVLAKPGVTLRYDLPDIHEIILAGDLAVVRLTWTLHAEAGGKAETTTEEGIDIFRRQPDARWSIARYIAFSNSPSTIVP